MISYQKFMLHQALRRRAFVGTPENDHEHCVMCGFKFTACMTGCATLDGRHWVCEDCVSDFRSEYDWTFEDDTPPSQGHLRS